MGRNLLGGKKKKRCKNKNTDNTLTIKKLTFKEESQDYALVTKMLGDGRLLATTENYIDILCIIRGKLRKRVWINVGDLILISYRDFQTKKADVILKYNEYEISELKRIGELNSLNNNSKTSFDDDKDDCVFDFDTI